MKIAGAILCVPVVLYQNHKRELLKEDLSLRVANNQAKANRVVAKRLLKLIAAQNFGSNS